MSYVKYKVKFPCGYEIECEASMFGGGVEWNDSDLDKCPLHGKKCKGKKK